MLHFISSTRKKSQYIRPVFCRVMFTLVSFDLIMILLIIINFAMVFAGPATDASFKDQSCTDPRTMKKHAAYTEWADAYSCTRHRCQPGGRNLAIYTVGCKHVEAPESAIECEEVVEDTNMQFPYCCTRLRCLVVVRGEVWTKVLGQPWETLPAAPWSHMYKMKKPPPGDTFLPKSTNEGPIYELTSDTEHDKTHKVMRASQKNTKNCREGSEISPRAAIAAPDIVVSNYHVQIALSTNSEQKDHDKDFKKTDMFGKRSGRKQSSKPADNQYLDEETREDINEMENEDAYTEKAPDASEEKLYANRDVMEKEPSKSWTEIPQTQWNEHDMDAESPLLEAEEKSFYSQPEYQQESQKDEKPSNFQSLVDAIGTRMRDIENVVQKISESVYQVKPVEPELSAEKKVLSDQEEESYKHHIEEKEHRKESKAKRPSADSDHYMRFTRKGGSKYLHGGTYTTSEQPLFIEDNSINGYFSDASNSVLRRGSRNQPKEPPLTYMAPVDTRRKPHDQHEQSEELVKKHKKHSHKRKHSKGKNHKKHHRNEKRKRFNRLNSAEIDKIVVSLEDSSAVVKK